MPTIELVNPVAPEGPPPTDLRMAQRQPLGPGARIMLINNGKPRARELMQMIAERLATRFGAADIRVFDKGSASRVIDDDEIARIASFAATMGMPGYHSALVPHPVSSKDDIQLAAYATAVVDQVEQQLSASNRDAVAG